MILVHRSTDGTVLLTLTLRGDFSSGECRVTELSAELTLEGWHTHQKVKVTGHVFLRFLQLNGEKRSEIVRGRLELVHTSGTMILGSSRCLLQSATEQEIGKQVRERELPELGWHPQFPETAVWLDGWQGLSSEVVRWLNENNLTHSALGQALRVKKEWDPKGLWEIDKNNPCDLKTFVILGRLPIELGTVSTWRPEAIRGTIDQGTIESLFLSSSATSEKPVSFDFTLRPDGLKASGQTKFSFTGFGDGKKNLRLRAGDSLWLDPGPGRGEWLRLQVADGGTAVSFPERDPKTGLPFKKSRYRIPDHRGGFFEFTPLPGSQSRFELSISDERIDFKLPDEHLLAYYGPTERGICSSEFPCSKSKLVEGRLVFSAHKHGQYELTNEAVMMASENSEAVKALHSLRYPARAIVLPFRTPPRRPDAPAAEEVTDVELTSTEDWDFGAGLVTHGLLEFSYPTWDLVLDEETHQYRAPLALLPWVERTQKGSSTKDVLHWRNLLLETQEWRLAAAYAEENEKLANSESPFQARQSIRDRHTVRDEGPKLKEGTFPSIEVDDRVLTISPVLRDQLPETAGYKGFTEVDGDGLGNVVPRLQAHDSGLTSAGGAERTWYSEIQISAKHNEPADKHDIRLNLFGWQRSKPTAGFQAMRHDQSWEEPWPRIFGLGFAVRQVEQVSEDRIDLEGVLLPPLAEPCLSQVVGKNVQRNLASPASCQVALTLNANRWIVAEINGQIEWDFSYALPKASNTSAPFLRIFSELTLRDDQLVFTESRALIGLFGTTRELRLCDFIPEVSNTKPCLSMFIADQSNSSVFTYRTDMDGRPGQVPVGLARTKQSPHALTFHKPTGWLFCLCHKKELKSWLGGIKLTNGVAQGPLIEKNWREAAKEDDERQSEFISLVHSKGDNLFATLRGPMMTKRLEAKKLQFKLTDVDKFGGNVLPCYSPTTERLWSANGSKLVYWDKALKGLQDPKIDGGSDFHAFATHPRLPVVYAGTLGPQKFQARVFVIFDQEEPKTPTAEAEIEFEVEINREPSGPQNVESIVVSPDGNLLFAALGDGIYYLPLDSRGLPVGGLRLRPFGTKSSSVGTTGSLTDLRNLQFHPSGRYLYAVQRKLPKGGVLHAFTIDNGAVGQRDFRVELGNFKFEIDKTEDQNGAKKSWMEALAFAQTKRKETRLVGTALEARSHEQNISSSGEDIEAAAFAPSGDVVWVSHHSTSRKLRTWGLGSGPGREFQLSSENGVEDVFVLECNKLNLKVLLSLDGELQFLSLSGGSTSLENDCLGVAVLSTTRFAVLKKKKVLWFEWTGDEPFESGNPVDLEENELKFSCMCSVSGDSSLVFAAATESRRDEIFRCTWGMEQADRIEAEGSILHMNAFVAGVERFQMLLIDDLMDLSVQTLDGVANRTFMDFSHPLDDKHDRIIGLTEGFDGAWLLFLARDNSTYVLQVAEPLDKSQEHPEPTIREIYRTESSSALAVRKFGNQYRLLLRDSGGRLRVQQLNCQQLTLSQEIAKYSGLLLELEDGAFELHCNEGLQLEEYGNEAYAPAAVQNSRLGFVRHVTDVSEVVALWPGHSSVKSLELSEKLWRNKGFLLEIGTLKFRGWCIEVHDERRRHTLITAELLAVHEGKKHTLSIHEQPLSDGKMSAHLSADDWQAVVQLIQHQNGTWTFIGGIYGAFTPISQDEVFIDLSTPSGAINFTYLDDYVPLTDDLYHFDSSQLKFVKVEFLWDRTVDSWEVKNLPTHNRTMPTFLSRQAFGFRLRHQWAQFEKSGTVREPAQGPPASGELVKFCPLVIQDRGLAFNDNKIWRHEPDGQTFLSKVVNHWALPHPDSEVGFAPSTIPVTSIEGGDDNQDSSKTIELPERVNVGPKVLEVVRTQRLDELGKWRPARYRFLQENFTIPDPLIRVMTAKVTESLSLPQLPFGSLSIDTELQVQPTEPAPELTGTERAVRRTTWSCLPKTDNANETTRSALRIYEWTCFAGACTPQLLLDGTIKQNVGSSARGEQPKATGAVTDQEFSFLPPTVQLEYGPDKPGAMIFHKAVPIRQTGTNDEIEKRTSMGIPAQVALRDPLRVRPPGTSTLEVLPEKKQLRILERLETYDLGELASEDVLRTADRPPSAFDTHYFVTVVGGQLLVAKSGERIVTEDINGIHIVSRIKALETFKVKSVKFQLENIDSIDEALSSDKYFCRRLKLGEEKDKIVAGWTKNDKLEEEEHRHDVAVVPTTMKPTYVVVARQNGTERTVAVGGERAEPILSIERDQLVLRRQLVCPIEPKAKVEYVVLKSFANGEVQAAAAVSGTG